MKSLALLLWIFSAIALQLAIFLGIRFWRHWGDYRALRGQARALAAGLEDAAAAADEAPPHAAWQGLRAFRVERKVFEDAQQSVCSFYLKPEDGQPLPPYLPGQFLTFRLDLPSAAGGSEAIVRCYSLSDAPDPEHYRISIKRAAAPTAALPPGRSSSFFHDQVDVGSVVQLRAPGGHFYLERGKVPAVLIAGGIGITPMLSMLNWSLREQPERDIWLFYGVRNARELVLRPALVALAEAHANFHLHFCFSDPLAGEGVEGGERAHVHHGRIDVPLLRLQLPLKPAHFYICGPTPMMQSLIPALEDWGVPDERIHFEAFGPASIKRKTAAAAVKAGATDGVAGALAQIGAANIAVSDAASDIVITFARSGKQLPWLAGTASLLDFAEANGVKVDSGCRAGGCGTCQTTIRSGEVAYRQAPDYDPEPGSCLLCVCTPKTSVTLEA